MCKQCSVEINYFLLDIKNSKRSKTILSLKEKYKFFIKNVLQPVDPLNQSKSGVGNFFSRRAIFTKTNSSQARLKEKNSFAALSSF